jgi:hypothetical protein
MAMNKLQRWLDPPAVIERKRTLRAIHGRGHSGRPLDFEVGVAVPIGCALPLAVLLAAGIGLTVGALIGQRWQPADAPPSSVEVRVIDDGARGGPAVLATALVPLR